eukprot:CAMPEP_0175632576 /NCGR_PEP_ID=MMETSP0097-20121207/188_1 /TAXON_ID=311494 /ORGANISM="Alexandrium monilatum, Strain CCMP3105" /LENGTH=60 /DNA_ID=CAMNT_0016938069 /DNA_START=113 /DNA_END=292 /DNA_ORIENTATION=+
MTRQEAGVNLEAVLECKCDQDASVPSCPVEFLSGGGVVWASRMYRSHMRRRPSIAKGRLA